MNYFYAILSFFQRNIELPFFGFFLLLKMYWFAKEIGILFSKNLIVVSVGSVLLLLAIGFIFNRITRLIVLTIISSIVSLIIYADLIYFRYFGDLITTPVLEQVNQIGGISDSIFELMNLGDIAFFLDVIFFLLIIIYLKTKKINQKITRVERAIIVVFMVSVGAYMVFTPIQAYTEKYGKALFVNTWSNVSIYEITGQLGFHAHDIYKYVDGRILNKTEISDDRRQEITQFLEKHRSPHLSESRYFGIGKGMNVILIQLESFQQYVIHNKINGSEITPNLNKLLTESYSFSNFYHQVGQGRTSDAEFISNNSLYPLPSGSVYVRYPSNKYESLASLLKELGYQTTAYHAYKKNFWNRQLVYSNLSFDTFIGKEDFDEGETAGPFETLGDEGLFLQMLEDDDTKQPYYKFVVALTSHHPFTQIPAQYKKLNVEPFSGTIFADYLHSTHYVDYAIGEMVQKMKEQGVWDNTILVIYGDHDNGVEFTEEYASALGMETDRVSLLTYKDKAPLIIHIPGLEQQAQEFNHSVGMTSITPTILHLLGYTGMTYHLGEQIFSEQDQLIPFRYGSFRQGSMYYKASIDGLFENGTCYDVQQKRAVNIENCRKGSEYTRNILRISDDIITHNLLNDS